MVGEDRKRGLSKGLFSDEAQDECWCRDQAGFVEAKHCRCGEGESLEAKIIRFGEGDPLEANPIRIGEEETPWGDSHSHWIGEPPWGESHSLWRRGLPWSESHSLWRGEAPWGESHSLGEGNPLDRGGPPGGESHSLWRRLPWSESHSLWRGGVPWGEFHSLGEREGDPLEANPIRCREGGNPLGRIPSTWRRGPPGQGGGLYEANSIRIGEGDPHEANPSLRRGGSPWGSFTMERGNPLKATPTCKASLCAAWKATSKARSLEASLGRWRSWGMTNLDVDDREHQVGEKPLEKRWLENAHPNTTPQELG